MHTKIVPLYDSLLSLLSNNRDAVLMYHSVDREFPLLNSYGNVTPSRFEQDLQYISNHYMLTDLRSIVYENNPLEKRVALTFDDGFYNFYTNVLPILRRYNAPATVFITPELMDEKELTKKIHNISSNNGQNNRKCLLMNENQIQELVNEPLVTIGNHTRSHPRLTKLSPEEQKQEIEGGKIDLEEMFDISARQFCYPYGDFDDTSVSIVKKSHDIAVTLESRLVGKNFDAFRVPRLHAHVSDVRLRKNILR